MNCSACRPEDDGSDEFEEDLRLRLAVLSILKRSRQGETAEEINQDTKSVIDVNDILLNEEAILKHGLHIDPKDPVLDMDCTEHGILDDAVYLWIAYARSKKQRVYKSQVFRKAVEYSLILGALDVLTTKGLRTNEAWFKQFKGRYKLPDFDQTCELEERKLELNQFGEVSTLSHPQLVQLVETLRETEKLMESCRCDKCQRNKRPCKQSKKNCPDKHRR